MDATGLAQVLLAAAPLLPLGLALGFLWPRARRVLEAMTPWAALPAVLLALLPEGSELTAPMLGLGTRVAVDATGRAFLLLNGLLWSAAALFARYYLERDTKRPVFFGFFLAAMAGSIGTCVAGDAATFYTFYALASFAAWPLVMYERTRAARRAARVYLALVVIGEACVFAAVALHVIEAGTASFARTPYSPGTWQLFLTIAGFGIKAGMMPLHVWLPLAHPVAPTPASAILSGVMIKAGVLGWIRFLPAGETAFPVWGSVLIVVGVAGAFAGVIFGLLQRSAKAALAYSSVSQMGFLALGVGVGLAHPSAWPALLTAVLLYALHHGLAKCALFLGVGVLDMAVTPRRRALAFALMAIPALSLAGAPFSSGALAKQGLKSGLPLPSDLLVGALPWLLPLAAGGTTLLMVRVLLLAAASSHKTDSPYVKAEDRGSWWRLAAPWMAIVLLVAVAGSRDAMTRVLRASPPPLGSATVAALPVATAVVIAWAAFRAMSRAHWQAPTLPAGDLFIALSGFARRIRRRVRLLASSRPTAASPHP